MTGFVIHPVRRDEASVLASLTWAAYRPLLSWQAEDHDRAKAIFLAAWAQRVPVGLALSQKSKPSVRTLLSLVVAPAWRRRGIGGALLRHLAARADEPLETQFSDRLPGAEGFAALLTHAGWSAAAPISHRICGPVHKTFSVFRDRSGIINRLSRQGFTLPDWAEAGERVLPTIAAWIADGTAPAWADPRPWLTRLHPRASLILTTAQGDLCGWVVCQYQPDLDRWYFPIGWVCQPQAGYGWLLGAYAEGAARLSRDHGPDTKVVVESGAGQPDMVRVLDRHFRPHADWSDRLLEATFTPP